MARARTLSCLFLSLLLPAGCGTATSTSTGAPATSAPTPASAPTPVAPMPPPPVAWRWQQVLPSTGSPWAAVGTDGTVFVAARTGCPVALDAFGPDGRERPGWPFCGDLAWPLGIDAIGTAYAVDASGQVVGIDATGTEGPGWPRPLGSGQGILSAGIVLGSPSGTLQAYDSAGGALPGWPVTVPGGIAEPILVTADDSVAVLYQDAATDRRFVTLIGPDGRTRPGWPVRAPDAMDGRSLQLDTVTADGHVVLRAHEPWPAGNVALPPGLRAQVTVIADDGTIPAGWPIEFETPLSAVVEGADGLLYAVAGDVVNGWRGDSWAGGPYTVVALRADGTAPAGWPVSLPQGMTPLPFATDPGPRPTWAQPPVVDAAGPIVIATGSVDARDGLAWIGRGGRVDGTCLLPEGVRIGSGPLTAPGGPPLAPVLSAGRAFLAATFEAGQAGSSSGDEPAVTSPGRGTLAGTAGKARTEALVAIGPGGPDAGWPLVLPTGAVINALFVGPDGTIIVLASGPGETVAVLAADPTAAGVGK